MHGNCIDLTGKTFGLLTVFQRASNNGPRARWHCRCECGSLKTVQANHLQSSKIKSCGCVNRTRNGLSVTREYQIWSHMIDRCYREENDNYRFYGALGTFVCQRWRESVSDFVDDMGVAPAKWTLDRINTHGHYTCGKCQECKDKNRPANCRWAPKAVQARNAKNNRYYSHNGKTLILKDWAKISGIPYITLWNRLNVGMSFADAISIKRYDRKAITRSKVSQ